MPDDSCYQSWAGTWDSYTNVDRCVDERKRLNPATEDYPDPWNDPESPGGEAHIPLTLSQTGCTVTASTTFTGTAFGGAGLDCPVTLTGTVDRDNVLSGTWKTSCDITFNGADNPLDSGTFTLRMDPGGTSFIGTFQGDSPDIASYIAETCPSKNTNWIGKRE